MSKCLDCGAELPQKKPGSPAFPGSFFPTVPFCDDCLNKNSPEDNEDTKSNDESETPSS